MDGTRNDRTEIAEALQQARRLLEARLAQREAGRALRQLLERERQGEALEAVAPAELLDRLIVGLAELGPDGVAYVGTMRALLALDGREPRLLARMSAAEAPAARAIAGAKASDEPGRASPVACAPLSSASAGSMQRSPVDARSGIAPPAIAMPPAAASVVATEPPTAQPAATAPAAVASPSRAFPPAKTAAAPHQATVASTSPPRGELDRIRLVDALAAATGAAERSRERYGGAVSWARPEASWQPPPEIEPLGGAGAGGRSLAAPAPAAREATSAGAATRPPPDTAASPVPSASHVIAVAAPAPATTGGLAALSEETRGAENGAKAPRPARLPRALDDADIEVDVEEAEVEIVSGRGTRPAVVPERSASPPMPLTLRLERREQQQIEFDGDSYAAYYDDLGEASVEIIRPPDLEPGSGAVVSPAEARAQATRRLPDALARKPG